MQENDLTNQQFGRLTALHDAGPSPKGQRLWLCQCTCGQTKLVKAYQLRSGKAGSCGCGRKEWGKQRGAASRKHGESGHRRGRVQHATAEYQAWTQCIQRCQNPKHQQYPDYGGRGLTVDPSWLGPDGYQNFLIDMGRRPTANHSLDRRDNSMGYSPHNCRWALPVEQNRNTRGNVTLTISGQTRVLAEWLEIKQLSRRTYYNRIQRGLIPEQALALPRPTGKTRGRPKRLP